MIGYREWAQSWAQAAPIYCSRTVRGAEWRLGVQRLCAMQKGLRDGAALLNLMVRQAKAPAITPTCDDE
jgi:hypothetical protein